MSSLVPATEYFFKDRQVQRAANTVYEYVTAFNAANVVKYQFKSDYERMQYMIGREGRVVHSILVPTPPMDLTGTTGNTVVHLNWLAPLLSEAPVIYYKIISDPPTTTNYSVTTNITITGLTNLTGYIFTVYAKNHVGFSLPSHPSASLVPHNVPTAPRNVVVSGGNEQVTVSWDAPSNDGGIPIDIYTVTSSPENISVTVSGSARTATVTGLTNGVEYRFTVVAHNFSGNSAPSTVSDPVTPDMVPVNITVNLSGIVFGEGQNGYNNTLTFSETASLIISFSNIDLSISNVTHIGFTRFEPPLLSSTDTFTLLYPTFSPEVTYIIYNDNHNTQIYTNMQAGHVSATTNIVLTFETPISSILFTIN